MAVLTLPHGSKLMIGAVKLTALKPPLVSASFTKGDMVSELIICPANCRSALAIESSIGGIGTLTVVGWPVVGSVSTTVAWHVWGTSLVALCTCTVNAVSGAPASECPDGSNGRLSTVKFQ